VKEWQPSAADLLLSTLDQIMTRQTFSKRNTLQCKVNVDVKENTIVLEHGSGQQAIIQKMRLGKAVALVEAEILQEE
jgi:uncharacterized protein (UPF0261 family)